MPTLSDAVQYIRMGNRERGRQILEQILETEENNEEIWLWLSAVVESDEDREICFENVLALDANNGIAQRGLNALRAGRFSSGEMIGELLEQGEQEESTTFGGDFGAAEDDAEELVLPSTMSKQAPKPKGRAKAKRGGGINVRLLILIGLVLVVILVLGAVAAYSMLGGNGGEATTVPEETPPTQPAQEVAPPTDTPAPVPTDTPTATPTPPTPRLQLPTPIPTTVPSPTATRVVSPTPAR